MKTIPIIFASDDNYIPPLSVTITSMKINRSKKFNYRLIVLTDNVSNENMDKIKNIEEENFTIEFNNVSKYFTGIKKTLCLRDYYTLSTYFRFLIPDLYKEYDKAIYLDSDLLITGDISELFFTPIGDNLLGAVTEDFVITKENFSLYVEKVLGVNRWEYFNAGVLLMNLKLFREENIFSKFINLSKKRKFKVAQDQDYLNVLANNRVKMLAHSWNVGAFDNAVYPVNEINIVHFKLNYKPWHYDKVLYSDLFFSYAAKTVYYEDLINIRNNYSEEDIQKDLLGLINLSNLANKEIDDIRDEILSNEEYMYQKA